MSHLRVKWVVPESSQNHLRFVSESNESFQSRLRVTSERNESFQSSLRVQWVIYNLDQESLNHLRVKWAAFNFPLPPPAEEEELMCEFLLENSMIWDIKKKNDYRRIDKKAKLWEDQAIAMARTVEHLQGWFKSLRDVHTRLHKKKSGDGAQ